jgi:hypothetical protein
MLSGDMTHSALLAGLLIMVTLPTSARAGDVRFACGAQNASLAVRQAARNVSVRPQPRALLACFREGARMTPQCSVQSARLM